jgi:hypothetical protein
MLSDLFLLDSRKQDLKYQTEDLHSWILRAYRRTASVAMCETAKWRMNTGDLRLSLKALHNIRVTGLWTPCTRLIRKHLNRH